MKKNSKEIVAERLDQLMKASPELGSQQKLAAKTGIGQTTIGRIRRGEVNATLENIKAIADAFHVPVGYLYGQEPDLGAPDNTPDEQTFTLIPELDVHASCGVGGKFHDHIVVTGGLAFKRTFLSEVGVNEEHARIIHADGPSMEPTIGHGRVVLVNTADNTPQDGRVFLICDEDGGMILKRLVREYEPTVGATVWKIRSDNPDKRKYPDKFWPEDARACIVGRAVWHDGLL